MILVIEILIVIAAFIVLGRSGIRMVRRAMDLGRSAKIMSEHAQPRVMALKTQSDVAQQRVFSITGNADLLQRKIEPLLIAMRRLIVVINALREGFYRVSLGLRILGL